MFLLPISALAGESGVAPNVISLPDGPGSIEGLGEEFEPGANTGTAIYGVPIAVPEGSGGFKPALKLIYSGGNGNSSLGFGWSMPLPRIQRQTDKGLPRYDGSDTYIYNDGGTSEELVPLADGSYRLKNEGAFIRATKVGGGWEVHTKGGIIYRLGTLSASRIKDAANTRTFAWNINEAEDTNGNRIAYEWFADGNQLYLSKITYNDYSSDVALEVAFTYESRSDALADYRATFPIVTALRMTKIDVRRGGRLVRSYRLEYAKEVATSLSRLSAITLVGSDGATSMPPVVFDYTQFTPADQPVVEMQNAPGRALNDPNNALVDLNGDSLPDFISTSTGDHRYYINEDGVSWSAQFGMAASPSYELSQDGVRLADLTGDGISDLVVARGVSGNSYLAGTGEESWEPSVAFDNNPVGFDPANDNTKFVDLNGDRLIDVIRTNLTGLNAWIHEGGGAYTRLGSLPRIDNSEQILLSDAQIQLADFNGDGLLDVTRLRSGSLVYWPSMGYGLFDEPVIMSGTPHVDDETRLHAVDLNGDGLSDIVYTGINYVGYWLNRGDGSFDNENDITGTPSVDPINTAVQFADMNGNGTTDIVWVDVSGGPDGAWQYLDPIGDQYAGLITRIDNGLGKVVTVVYESSTAQMIRAADEGSAWTTTMPFPVQVISRVTVDDSLGAQGVTYHAYRDGYYDGIEREFRGFAGSIVTEQGDDSIAALVSTRIFDVGKTAEVLKGKLLDQKLAADSGAVLQRIQNSWSTTVLEDGTDGRDIVFAHLDAAVTEHAEGGASSKFTRTDFYYDEYGNTVDELNHGEVNSAADDGSTPIGNDEVFVHRDFAIDENDWILDRTSRERVRDSAGKKISDVINYYDGEVFNGLPLGQVDRGNLMREDRWLDTENAYISTVRNRYDEWGNVTAILDANGGRRELFYDSESHTYPIRERIFTGSYALDMVATYDPVFGKVASLTDPNGVVTSATYDAFGRTAKVVRPGDSAAYPTVTYEYMMGAPKSIIAIKARESAGLPATVDTFRYIDGLGRQFAEMIEDEGGVYAVTKAVQYNARGKESFIAEPFRTSSPSTLWGEGWGEGQGEGTRLYYDALGRVTQTINPDGTASLAEYRPLAERLFDENDADGSSKHHNTPTTKNYDGQGKLITTSFKDGTRDLTTGFGYDAVGNLTSIVDPAGNTRAIQYDTMGRMIAQDDPNAGHRDYKYDGVGNLIEKIKPDGKSVKFTYELTTNRVTAKNLVTSSGDDTWEVKYHYDYPSADWERYGDYVKGRLAWIEDAAGMEYYGYDARGNVVAKRRIVDGAGYELNYAYDAMDRQTNATYPDGSTLITKYNARGLAKVIGPYLVDRSYNAAGQVETEVLGDGISRNYEYDSRRRVVNGATTSSDGVIIQQFSSDFDAASNVTQINDMRTDIDAMQSQTQSFDYDDLYRLTTANVNDGSISWAYDDVGNITGKSTTLDDARFNAANILYGQNGAGPYALTTHGDKTYSYDANGNLSAMPGQSLAFDPEDRLTAVTKDDGTVVEMIYDSTGQRKIKRAGSATTLYIDPSYEIRGESHYKYIWADGKRIAREIADGTTITTAMMETSSPHFTAAGLSALPPLPLGEGWGEGAWVCVVGALLALMLAAIRQSASALRAYGITARALASFLALMLLSVTSVPMITGCGGSGPADPSVSTGPQEGVVYYIDDHLGSSHLVTDSLGNVLREESRYPYGLERNVSDSAVTADYVYTGKEYDSETGLIYFGGRYYAPELGRWITPDPLFLDREPAKITEMPKELNLYAYVQGNPMTYFDSSGLKATIIVSNKRIRKDDNSYSMEVRHTSADNKITNRAYEVGRDVAKGKTPYSGGGKLAAPVWVPEKNRVRMGDKIMALPDNKGEGIHTGRNKHEHITWGCIRMDQKDFDDFGDLLKDEAVDKWGWYKEVNIAVEE